MLEGGNNVDSISTISVPPRPNSAIELLSASRRNSIISEGEEGEPESATAPPSNPDTPAITMNFGNGKAYYYSQLSIMLFEKAVEENPAFPEDLDRVHSWFTKELSDAQKLVCLHELLSLISPSQHRFLFTSISFDSTQTTEDESVWLDLAMSDSQKHNSSIRNPTSKLEDRLKSLDLTPGESLFSGIKVSSKSKLSFEKEPVDVSKVDYNLTNKPDDSKFSNFLNLPNDQKKAVSTGKAPPGFLSPTAAEFRPSEPSCHADVYMTDFPQWLRLLRLHKYQETLSPHYNKDRHQLLKSSEEQLEAAGVAAMGARRKFLRLFERIRGEKHIN